jgi:hypothetical protein
MLIALNVRGRCPVCLLQVVSHELQASLANGSGPGRPDIAEKLCMLLLLLPPPHAWLGERPAAGAVAEQHAAWAQLLAAPPTSVVQVRALGAHMEFCKAGQAVG